MEDARCDLSPSYSHTQAHSHTHMHMHTCACARAHTHTHTLKTNRNLWGIQKMHCLKITLAFRNWYMDIRTN